MYIDTILTSKNPFLSLNTYTYIYIFLYDISGNDRRRISIANNIDGSTKVISGSNRSNININCGNFNLWNIVIVIKYSVIQRESRGKVVSSGRTFNEKDQIVLKERGG